jgi:type 1 fimbriae regulatory protein FimB
MYRPGLRVCETVRLTKDQVNLRQARIWVKRAKGSLDTEQPLSGDELRAIKRYLATREDHLPRLFVSERGQQMVRWTVNYIIGEAGKRAGLGHVHRTCCATRAGTGSPTRARTSASFRTGSTDPKHTSKYTRVAARRFEGVWD